ncbi:aminoacyl-histidine dipeptidase [Peptoniphilus sp. ING2-D1G]|nr:aminoacyl-histidine dipeptidase [Peptoniphilus sp. ING2-D1G]
MNKLNNLEPKRVFYYFEEITKIPRCSFKEDKIADYLVNFAKSLRLNYIRDDYNNVIIKKKATEGYENSNPVIIQAHTDMVCEKNEDFVFDFDEDSIEFEIVNNLIVADNTTLGADDGIGVAIALALLESDEYEHPDLEVLLTATEESGMIGARNLDGKLLSGKSLINLDSESEGVACVGCASGQRDIIILKKEFEEVEEDREYYLLSVSGLKGGHSGEEIHKGLGNSNKILGKSLYRLNNDFDIRLMDIYGGSKENAIPRYSKSIIAIKPEDKKKVQDVIVELNKNFVKELGRVDPDVRINFEKSEKYNKAFTKDLKNNIIDLINLLPDGVSTMSHNVEGLVGLSANLGVIESRIDDIIIHSSIRSELESLRDGISDVNKIAAKRCNAKHKVVNNYPAWEYKENSTIRNIAKDVYKKLFDKELKIEVIHAGLECGILKNVIGDIDMISIGPNMKGIHAPGESLDIKSVQNTFEFVVELIKNLK